MTPFRQSLSTMTPRAKKITINSALASVLLAAALWFAPRAAAFVEDRYVHSVVYDKNRILDSLNYRQDIRDIRTMLSRLDTAVKTSPRR